MTVSRQVYRKTHADDHGYPACGIPTGTARLSSDPAEIDCLSCLKLVKPELLPRSTCLAHLLPEPCPTCAAYIAGGL